jgi:hypothetical protein
VIAVLLLAALIVLTAAIPHGHAQTIRPRKARR